MWCVLVWGPERRVDPENSIRDASGENMALCWLGRFGCGYRIGLRVGGN